ncbi:S41 family peptidase [Cryomorphaceae bacterium 1068]|nr:S41 family peptidase [Cryomorphaceae bacterium 1068]
MSSTTNLRTKSTIVLLFVFSIFSSLVCLAQPNHQEIREDLSEILNDIEQNYIYLQDKKVDLECIKAFYFSQIERIKSEEETVLFFEYLLDEFYDNHLMLMTNRSSSYRLFAPIYLSMQNDRAVVSSLWLSQSSGFVQELLGAELVAFNGVTLDQQIIDFPTHCQDKDDPEVREWIVNKIISGRYNKPRILTLKMSDGTIFYFDLDRVKFNEDKNLLSHTIKEDIGIIRINNSLGRDEVINAFDAALDSLWDTKGLIIDLRNTLSGGDTYEARGIMSRFVDEPSPYQRHSFFETGETTPAVERYFIEYVTPRGIQYKKPVVILVGRWTGSMGEGMAIGFEGMGRAKVVGSEMRRLAGEVYNFGFKHQSYGYKISTAKLFHINGTIRESYVPVNYVSQTSLSTDEVLDAGIELILKENLNPDSLLAEELEMLGIQDQMLRKLLPETEELFGRDSREYKHMWALIDQQDSICTKKLLTILEDEGWVGKSRVGPEANQAIWLIIQHASLPTQEKYLPLLIASVREGESEGWQLAYLQDRVSVRKGEKQVYGTQALWDDELKKNVIQPIRDVKNVNERRSEIGLDSIEEHAASNGYLFDQ